MRFENRNGLPANLAGDNFVIHLIVLAAGIGIEQIYYANRVFGRKGVIDLHRKKILRSDLRTANAVYPGIASDLSIRQRIESGDEPCHRRVRRNIARRKLTSSRSRGGYVNDGGESLSP